MRILNLKSTIVAVCLFAVIMATFGVHGENQSSDVKLSQPKAIHLSPVYGDLTKKIILVFDESVNTERSHISVTAGPDPLKWSVAWLHNDTVAKLTAGPGETLTADTTYVISGTIADSAGNAGDIEITFTTKAKE